MIEIQFSSLIILFLMGLVIGLMVGVSLARPVIR